MTQYPPCPMQQGDDNVSRYLSIYWGGLSNEYERAFNTAAARADLIVDGLKRPEDLAMEVLGKFTRHRERWTNDALYPIPGSGNP